MIGIRPRHCPQPSKAGDAYLVEYLLSEGAEVNHAVRYRSILDGDTWRTPLDIATENDLSDCHNRHQLSRGRVGGSDR